MECQIKGEPVSTQIRAPKVRINGSEPAVESPGMPRRQESEEVDHGTRWKRRVYRAKGSSSNLAKSQTDAHDKG